MTIVESTYEFDAADLSETKVRQQSTWASGDYAHVGSRLQIVGENLATDLDLRPGQQVLDVAAGNGNFSLAAARQYTRVASTDFVPSLLEKGRIRALAEGLDVNFQLADAEALPYADESFDVVGSTFGVMFTPNQQQAAGELVRVCRTGGKIGMANWTPTGFVGQLFKIVARYLHNPLPSPSLWGDAAHVQSLFTVASSNIEIKPCSYSFKYISPVAWLENFKIIYGPVRKAFSALADADQQRLQSDLLGLINRMNVARDGTLKIPGDYIQVIVTK